MKATSQPATEPRRVSRRPAKRFPVTIVGAAGLVAAVSVISVLTLMTTGSVLGHDGDRENDHVCTSGAEHESTGRHMLYVGIAHDLLSPSQNSHVSAGSGVSNVSVKKIPNTFDYLGHTATAPSHLNVYAITYTVTSLPGVLNICWELGSHLWYPFRIGGDGDGNTDTDNDRSPTPGSTDSPNAAPTYTPMPTETPTPTSRRSNSRRTRRGPFDFETPTPTPSPTAVPAIARAQSQAPTATPTPTAAPVIARKQPRAPTATATPTPTPTIPVYWYPTVVPTPTATLTPGPTSTPTRIPIPTMTATATPTPTPTPTPDDSDSVSFARSIPPTPTPTPQGLAASSGPKHTPAPAPAREDAQKEDRDDPGEIRTLIAGLTATGIIMSCGIYIAFMVWRWRRRKRRFSR